MAVIVAVRVVVPDLLVTANVAEVLPAKTVTLEGTVATLVLLLDNVTVAPPTAAGPVSVIVAVEVAPPRNDVGFKERVEAAALLIVNDVVRFARL